MFRVAPATAAPALASRAASGRRSNQAGATGGYAIGIGGAVAPADVSAKDLAVEFAKQARFVNGRTFYQNGNIWIDSEVQKQLQSKRTRLVFGSDEYFEFIRKYPQTLAWLSLGRNVQFVLDGVVYEVVETAAATP